MKRLIALVLTLVCVMSIAGCASKINRGTHQTPIENNQNNTDKTEFSMKNYLEYTIPKGYSETEYQPYVQESFSGILFTGYEEPHHSEYTLNSWYCAGGLLFSTDTQKLVFADDKLVDIHWGENHMLRTQEPEIVEGCNLQAIITEYTFDLFTAAEAIEYEEKHQIVLSDEDIVSRYWYIFFGEEDESEFYAAFLNTKLFSKEDAIEYAKTLRFKKF